MPIDIANLLSPEGAIARRLEGFESRPQQVEMAGAVETTLERRGQLLVEAGTGVGKSFAYLIPAVKRIVEHEERVVVVTNTINLQEQLVEKDIPLLNAVIPEEFSAVLVKGRGNYVSLRRLKLASERQDRLFGNDDARHSLHVVEDWATTTRDGTLATLPQLARPEVWDYAQSDSQNCMGKKCPTYRKCFYQTARRRMENGDLLVCNHALFFSDLALRAGEGVGFLPQYDHVILDEAHCVEEVAADHFGISLSEGRVRHLLGLLHQPRTGRGFLTTVKTKPEACNAVAEAIKLVNDAQYASERLFTSLIDWHGHAGANGRIRTRNIVDNPLSPVMKVLAAHLRLVKAGVLSEPDEYELNSYAQRAEEIGQSAAILIEQQVEGCVYFLEGVDEYSLRSRASGGAPQRRFGARPRVSLRSVAVDVSAILRERLFSRNISVVMTSATLATGPDDFSHITERLGCDNAATLHLGSPFDYASQMRLYVDRSLPEPNDPEYVERAVPRIEEHVRRTDGGAFVLFTSFAMLRRVARELKPRLLELDYPVLVHGEDGPPGLLLKRFREDDRSVLLGTNSFWQGVDVRGRGLRNVIITRLPFDVPDRPLVEARHELIAAQGGHPFLDDQVPRAVIRFKQGVGRLIRSTTDEGQVAVLDPRLVTKPYGRMFLNALPEGVRVQSEVDDF